MSEVYPEQDYLKMIVDGIAEKPEAVKIERRVDDMGVLYTVSVADEDIAKVIGKEGKTAKAIRLLLKTVGYKYHVRASMKVDIPEKK